MRTPRQHAAETRAIMKTLPKTDAGIFGAIDKAKKKVALPALQRAIRNELTLDEKDNGAAAITLARLHRTMTAGDAPEADAQTWDFEAAPFPNLDTRLDMGLSPARLKQVKPKDFRVVWYGAQMQAEVFVNGKWQPLLETWKLRPANDNQKQIEPRMHVERRAISPLDAEDRGLFEALVGEDDLADLELVANGAAMREIGEAAGFSGKQAEAVGLDRTRRAVKVAKRAFNTIGRLNASIYWWQRLADNDLVPAHLVKRRLAA